MKRFVVQLKGSVGFATIPIPSAVEVAQGFNVAWSDEPEASPKMTQHGMVPDESFVLLQHKFEDTGFYVMFDDTPVHTH